MTLTLMSTSPLLQVWTTLLTYPISQGCRVVSTQHALDCAQARVTTADQDLVSPADGEDCTNSAAGTAAEENWGSSSFTVHMGFQKAVVTSHLMATQDQRQKPQKPPQQQEKREMHKKQQMQRKRQNCWAWPWRPAPAA